MQSPEPPALPIHRCMECKAQRPYTVEQFSNGNAGWLCTVCGKSST